MNAAFAPTQLAWLDTLRSMKERTGQSIKAALIDPFDHTVTVVELEPQFVLGEEPYFGKLRKRANLHPPEGVQSELLRTGAGIGSTALTEDLQSGIYNCLRGAAG